MGLTPDQSLSVKEWNEIISTKVESALGSELNGKFTAANYPAGFNYIVKQTTYNPGSMLALDSKLVVKDECPSLESKYSTLYKSVIEKIHFNISKEDQQRINKEANEQAGLVSSIVTAYKQSGIDDKTTKYPDVPTIMARIQKVTGKTFDEVDVGKYPYLSTLCNLLSEFTRKAIFTSKIQRAAAKAEARLQAIINHIDTPTDDNGGLKTDDDYVCGWENIQEPSQLKDKLEQGNSISFTFSANNFHDNSSHLNFNNKIHADVPVNWFFHIGGEHEDKYNFDSYASNGAEVSVTVTYSGITLIPANPTELSANNKKGWYASDILEETAAKSGKDVTGYQLVDSKYNAKTLFGKNGKLRRMKTLVISQLPSIKLHFSKFDCERLLKSFEEQTELNFQMLNGFISAGSSNKYACSESKYDKNSQSLDVTLSPLPLGTSGTAENQTAYVLGGVVDYIDNEVEVNKIRFIDDENDDENMTVPEEFSGLTLKYRKNKDGRYEFAGLYDENEDIEYQLGDTVAVPMTSRYIDAVTLRRGVWVENVQGSTPDKCSLKGARESWLNFWSRMTGTPLEQKRCAVCKKWNNNCEHKRGIFVGAHVVISGHNVVPHGDEQLYIIPLCSHYNNYTHEEPMQLQYNVPAIRMDRFLSH